MNAYFNYLKQLTLYAYPKILSTLHKLYERYKLPLSAATLTKLNPVKQYRLDIGHPDRIVILLVGAGGTSSPSLTR